MVVCISVLALQWAGNLSRVYLASGLVAAETCTCYVSTNNRVLSKKQLEIVSLSICYHLFS